MHISVGRSTTSNVPVLTLIYLRGSSSAIANIVINVDCRPIARQSATDWTARSHVTLCCLLDPKRVARQRTTMFGISIVAVSLLLHQQLSIMGLLMSSTAETTPVTGSATKLAPDGASTDDINESSQRNGNGYFSDDVDRLPVMEPQSDEWRPEESVRQLRINEEDSIAVGQGQRHRSRLHPGLLNSHLGDSKQQQQLHQRSLATSEAAALLHGLVKRRAHIFVGKRSGSGPLSGLRHSFGIRPEADNDEAEIEDDKRGRMFVGKRPSSTVYHDDDEAANDTVDVDDWELSRQLGDELASAEKRSRMFVGKKYAPVFVG